MHLIASLPDAVPTSWYDVLLLPFFLGLIGAVVFISGRSAELKMGATWKWWALLPMALALWIGFKPVKYLFDPVYRGAAEEYGRKMILGHYMAFGFPVILILAAVAWHFAEKRTLTYR